MMAALIYPGKSRTKDSTFAEESDSVDPKDMEICCGYIDCGAVAEAEPLVEVCSVTIKPHEDYKSCRIYGEIYVVDSHGDTIYVYDRDKTNPEIIISGGPNNLLLTGPETGVIKMDGPLSMTVKLKVRGLNNKAWNFGKKRLSQSPANESTSSLKPARSNRGGVQSQIPRDRFCIYATKGRYVPKPVAALPRDLCFGPQAAAAAPTVVWFAKGCQNLDIAAEVCYDEYKCLSFDGNLGTVDIYYITIPCARIADLGVTITKRKDANAKRGSFNVISGSIMAYHGKTYGHIGCDSSDKYYSIVLCKNLEKSRERMAYGDSIKLCRSLVCAPSYSSLLVKVYLALRCGDAKGQFRSCEIELDAFGCMYTKRTCLGNVCVSLLVDWLTSDQPEVILRKEKCLKGPQSRSPHQSVPNSSICRSVSSEVNILDGYRIQVLSVLVGHEDKEKVDIYGTIAMTFWDGSCYIFKTDEKHPKKLYLGKAVSLEGLTSYSHDHFSMFVKLKDTRGRLDLENCFTIYEHFYDKPGQWFNKPLCYVLPGKHGFAAVHFIVFNSAVKATVEISVIIKDSSDSCPMVYGTLVAQYNNYQYSTIYRRKYWRIVLFEKLQGKDALRLTEDGEIPLSTNVVSVPKGSSLVVDVDLHLGDVTSGTGNSAEHIMDQVEIKIGDVKSKKIEGQKYDIVVTTIWKPWYC